jgi:LDH2 family malate/lactate/ureidoglycolate dehydrogenase
MPVLTAEQLRTVSSSILKALGTPAHDAETVAQLLVEANLTGFDSHGVIRLSNYAQGIKMGAVKVGAKIQVVEETPSTAVVDGGWNLGQIVCQQAMNLCIQKAKTSIVGLVTVHHCHHIGRLNTYAEMALKENMIGIVSVNSSSSVAPFGGKTRQVGTNPLCFAIPAGAEPAMVLDMATAVWARGKVMVYHAQGKELPDGVIQDAEGNPTTDTAKYFTGGMLRPLGGPVGYKGFGLALLVEVLTGALTGAGCSNSEEYRARPFYGGNGVFLLAIDVGRLTDLRDYKRRVDDLLRTSRTSPTAPGFTEILIPGEPERRMREQRLREGIFVGEKTWSEITGLCSELNVAIP